MYMKYINPFLFVDLILIDSYFFNTFDCVEWYENLYPFSTDW